MSGREQCSKPDAQTLFARMHKNSYSDSPRITKTKASFSRKHFSMDVMEARCQSVYRKNVVEKWNDYAREKTAINIIVHSERTKDDEKKKVILCSAEPFHGQRVKNLVRNAIENPETREYWQRRRKTSLCRVYFEHVFRGSEEAHCATLKKKRLYA